MKAIQARTPAARAACSVAKFGAGRRVLVHDLGLSRRRLERALDEPPSESVSFLRRAGADFRRSWPTLSEGELAVP